MSIFNIPSVRPFSFDCRMTLLLQQYCSSCDAVIRRLMLLQYSPLFSLPIGWWNTRSALIACVVHLCRRTANPGWSLPQLYIVLVDTGAFHVVPPVPVPLLLSPSPPPMPPPLTLIRLLLHANNVSTHRCHCIRPTITSKVRYAIQWPEQLCAPHVDDEGGE